MTSERSVGRATKTSQHLPRWAFNGGVALALALVSLLIGCLVNALRAEPLPWVYAGRAKTLDAAVDRLTTDAQATEIAPAHEIRLEDFHRIVLEGKGLVLDARGKVFYERSHVRGAVSLPREAFAEVYPRLRGKLDAHKDQPVVVYCSGADCPDAQLLADALGKLAYQPLLIYTSGWEEWSQTGLPQEGSAAQP